MKLKVYFLVLGITLITLSFYAQTGERVSTVNLVNVKNEKANVPDLGEKVVTVFYVDPDVQELNDPLSDALEEVKFPLDRFAVVGVANCKDTWLPNAGIRMKAKKKQDRYPQSLILLDYEQKLASAWNLGDCNNKLIVLVIGKDSEIKYMKAVESQSQSREIVSEFLKTIKKEIAA